MVSVTVLNAARMLEIEDSSIVSGSVNVSGNLILTTHGGNTIVAGHVRGDAGPQGPAGATGPQGAQGIAGSPASISDTNWINLPWAAGFSSTTATDQFQYRVRAGFVTIRGVGVGTFIAGTSHVVVPVGSIPAAYRPARIIRGGAAATANRPAVYQIPTDGSILMGTNGLASMPVWIAMLATYPID